MFQSQLEKTRCAHYCVGEFSSSPDLKGQHLKDLHLPFCIISLFVVNDGYLILLHLAE